MSYKYVKVNSDNIDDYSSVWIDVIQIASGSMKFDRAYQIFKHNKSAFLDVEQNYTNKNIRFDFYNFLRVLEVDDQPIALAYGLVRYFNDGVFLQVGCYGVLRKYQRHNYGKVFWEYIEEELRNKGINLAWGIMHNKGYWEKMGFVFDNKQTLKKYYNITETEKIFSKHISDKQNTTDDFMHMFNKEYGIDNTKQLYFLPNPEK